MIELTVAQIAEIVGGAVADISPQDAAHRRVTGTVEFDSRAIGPGGLFLALPGARADRSNSRLPTTLNARDQPPAEVSDQRVSGLTGAVQFQPRPGLSQSSTS